MPQSLEADARAFLEARRAPMTPGNMNSIMQFLAANPDKRPSYGASVAPPSDTTASAVESNVEKMLGNTNNSQQRALRKKIAIASPSTPSLNNQDTVTEPADQTASSEDQSTIQGNVSNAPGVTDDQPGGFVDPNNPPNAMAGVSNDPISSNINKLLAAGGAGAAAIGAGALAARGRTRPAEVAMNAIRNVDDIKRNAVDADVVSNVIDRQVVQSLPAPRRAIAGPQAASVAGNTLTIPARETRAIQSPARALSTDPSIPDTTAMSEAAVASGRANPIGHGRDTPLVQPATRDNVSPLKQQNRTRTRKRKKPIAEAAD